MQTEAVWYFRASSHRVQICGQVVVGFNAVWSTRARMSSLFNKKHRLS